MRATKQYLHNQEGMKQNYKSRIVPPLEKGGKMISQNNEIAKIFAHHYPKISRDPHMKSNSKKYIRRKKR